MKLTFNKSISKEKKPAKNTTFCPQNHHIHIKNIICDVKECVEVIVTINL